jgi:hypothetical protein
MRDGKLPSRPFEEDYNLLHEVLPVLGIVISAFVLAAVLAAIAVTLRLQAKWYDYEARTRDDRWPVASA